jgi:hypothetical protein
MEIEFIKVSQSNFLPPQSDDNGNYTLFFPDFLHIKPTESRVVSFGYKLMGRAIVCLAPKYQLHGLQGFNIINNEEITLPIFYSIPAMEVNRLDSILHGGFKGMSIKPNEEVGRLVLL